MEGAGGNDLPLESVASISPDVLQVILKKLSTSFVIRVSLASKEYQHLALSKAWSLCFHDKSQPSLDSPVDFKLRWTKILQNGCTLACLNTLYLDGPADINVTTQLVISAPNLQSLYFQPWTADTPLACGPELGLCSALKNHGSLRELKLYSLNPALCRIVPFFPAQLQELSFAGLKGKDMDQLFSDIATWCPGISSLTVFADQLIPFSAIERLRAMKNLKWLMLSRTDCNRNGSIFPSWPEACRLILRALSGALPRPKDNRWQLLRFGGSENEDVFLQFAENIPLLREAVELLCLYPSMYHLQHAVKCVMTDREQLAFLKFLLEECKVAPKICGCEFLKEVCLSCRWCMHIPGVQPNAARYLIETCFLPFVAAKSKQLGETRDKVACGLLLSFTASATQNEQTVLNYINNKAYPLDITAFPIPTFLHLKHKSTRQALFARAAATGAELGLRHPMGINNPQDYCKEALLHAAQIEPLFFINHLNMLTRLDEEAEILRLATSCPIEPSKRLDCLQQNQYIFTNESKVELLFSALKALLTPLELTTFVNQLILQEEFRGTVLEWLLNNGFSFDRLQRTDEGRNWLHYQLDSLLMHPGLGSKFDQELLKEVSILGNTPVHALCYCWDSWERLEMAMPSLEPHLDFIERNGLWQVKNNLGLTPLEAVELPPPDRDVPPALVEFVAKYSSKRVKPR